LRVRPPPRRRAARTTAEENTAIPPTDEVPNTAVGQDRKDGSNDRDNTTLGAGRQEPGLAHSRHLVDLVQASLEDDKAEDTVVIELANKSSIADYMVIASGRSRRQVGAMAAHLHEKLKKELGKVAVEGAARCDWVLIDGGDVIVHLFRPEVRAFYNLEKMWGAELPEPSRPAATA
jgi:ribosome-associated protein